MECMWCGSFGHNTDECGITKTDLDEEIDLLLFHGPLYPVKSERAKEAKKKIEEMEEQNEKNI